MIKEVGKLFEAITGPEWQTEDEGRGVLELYNPNRTRRLSYEGIKVEDGTRVLLEISYLNENGGWSKVFSMRHFSTSRGEEMTFVVWIRGDGKKPRWFDEMVSYDTRSGKRIGDGGSMPKPPFSGRVAEDRRELLYDVGELPERLDFEMTANLFVAQMARGEMERPILVPEGTMKEDWYFRPAGEFLRMAKDSQDPTEKKIYKAVARLLAEQ